MARSVAVTAGYFLVSAAAGLLLTWSGAPGRRLHRFAKGFNKVPSRYASLEKRLGLLAEPYMPALAEKRSRLLITGISGEMQGEAWAAELGQFISQSVLPRLGTDTPFAKRRLLYVAGWLDNRIAQLAEG
jgi:hypothetical protein